MYRIFRMYLERTIEGLFSWQHLGVVTSALIIAFVTAWELAKKSNSVDDRMDVLRKTAVLLVATELTRDIYYLFTSSSWWESLLSNLPLFFCGVPILFLPLGAFAKGKLQQAALDIVLIFGFLGGVLGTYLEANIYNSFPILHFHPLTSLATHMISAFASLYIAFSRSYSLSKDLMKTTFITLVGFIVISYSVNLMNRTLRLQDNYMFLSRSDGTPFSILESWFGSDTVA